MKEKFKGLGNKVLDILFPRHIKCVFCGEELNENAVHDCCEVCLKTLPFITNPCLRCGEQMQDSYSNVCTACFNKNRNFRQAKSVLEYTDKVVALVHKFKYSKKYIFAEQIVAFMAEVLATWNIEPDIICDVPIHKNKIKKVKKNHSSILATQIADKFDFKYLPLCEKVKDNPSQTEMAFKERQENVKDAYVVKPEFRKEVKDKTILIVDDVITTCATIDEISKTLLNAGAKEVYALSFAHTSLSKAENNLK